MNITTNNVEVSTPFFHENNTAAMNTIRDSYDLPTGSDATAESLAESLAENTFAYAMQSDLSHAAHKKQYAQECACGHECASHLGSPACNIILGNVERESQNVAKSKWIVMQHIRPISSETAALVGEGGVGLRSVRSAPTPWRWENRKTALLETCADSPQDRGKCLLHHPVTHPHLPYSHRFHSRTVHPTSFCFLREHDVIDNGTVMCLHKWGDECLYGNETMKAMLEFGSLYRQESRSTEMIGLVIYVLFLSGLFVSGLFLLLMILISLLITALKHLRGCILSLVENLRC